MYKTMKLKECAVIIAGQSPESKYYNTTGDGIPFFQGKADFGDLYPTVRVYCSQPLKIAEKNDILLSVRAPVGPTNLSPGKVCIGRGLAAIRPSEDVDVHYLLYFFKYFEAQLASKGTGTTFKSITQVLIKNLDIPVPPLSEQEKIVAHIEELFSKLDHAVEGLQKTKQQLAVYRQAVLKEAFKGELTSKWREKNAVDTADDILKEIQHNNSVVGYKSMMEEISLPMLPLQWKWVSIGDVSTGAEYGTSQKSQKSGIVPVLRMGNIQSGIFDWSDLVFTSDLAEIEKYKLKKGDVLFNRTNSPDLVGKTAAYEGNREAIYAGYLIRINQVSEINYKYLTFFLNSSVAKNYGEKVKTDGVNQSNINSQKLYSYPFPLCSLREQGRIVFELESRLSVCDSIEQTVDTALTQAEALRQSILKEAFEGRLA